MNDFSDAFQSPTDDWLISLGFKYGNPFAKVEAEQERDLLYRYFVDVEGYEKIKGKQTVLIFAPRGGGKSALRVQLASQATSTNHEKTPLVIEYTDFDLLIAKRRTGAIITIDDHIPQLLKVTVGTLMDLWCGRLADKTKLQEEGGYPPLEARVRQLTPPLRSYFFQLVQEYHPALICREALYERLRALAPLFSPDWRMFSEAVREKRLQHLIQLSPLGQNGIAAFLAEANDSAPEHSSLPKGPTELVTGLAQWVQEAGFAPIYILVDRLDEYRETVENPTLQSELLESLLSHLPILETPGIAFKFFLAQETRDILFARPAIRRDRLMDYIINIKWDAAQLRALLRARLLGYSENFFESFEQLSESAPITSGTKTYSLGEWLAQEMIGWAQGSPRRLLLAGQALCQAHVRRRGTEGLFEKEDWEIAKRALTERLPFTLLLKASSPIVICGSEEIKLTRQEHLILVTLAERGGICSREVMAQKIWPAAGPDDAISNAPIDAAMGRLRKKLGDDSSDPTYLLTLREVGFKLQHYEFDPS